MDSENTDVRMLLEFAGNNEFALGEQKMLAGAYDLAYKHFSNSAIFSHARGMYFVGRFHEEGIIVEPNDNRALTYYTRAAMLGEPMALRQLGSFYEHGRGGLVANAHIAHVCFAGAEHWESNQP